MALTGHYLMIRLIFIVFSLFFYSSVFAIDYVDVSVDKPCTDSYRTPMDYFTYRDSTSSAYTFHSSYKSQYSDTFYADVINTSGNVISAAWSITCVSDYYTQCSSPNAWALGFQYCRVPVINCTSPQVLDIATNTCIVPEKRDCVIPENPFTADCKYPTDKGNPIDCFDGTYVYAPATCPLNMWEQFLYDMTHFPKPNVVTCGSGESESACLQRRNDALTQQVTGGLTTSQFIDHAALALLGAPALKSVGLLADGFPAVKATFSAIEKINPQSLVTYSKIDAQLPTISVGKALVEYIKSSPTSSYVTGLVTTIGAIGLARTMMNVDSNTGAIVPSGSTIPLSPNQTLDLASSVSKSSVDPLPIPYPDLAPYVTPDSIPWLNPGIDAIEGDFTRVYDKESPKPAAFFPKVTSPNSVNLRKESVTEPIGDFTKDSPAKYRTKPSIDLPKFDLPDPCDIVQVFGGNCPDPCTLLEAVGGSCSDEQPNDPNQPDITNSTDLANPTNTSFIPQNTSTDPIDPNRIETPPTPPDVYPDTWKYFKFLKYANPFAFSVNDYLPDLPDTNCTYEIHRTFNVPFLGAKHFDFAPCEPLQPLRDVLAWAFGVLSIYICFIIIFGTKF